VTIGVTPAYIGCLSWVSVDDEISIDGSRQVVAAEDLNERLENIDAMLAASV